MAIERNFTGFEMGDIGELRFGGSGGGAQTVVVADGTARSGAYYLRSTSGSAGFDLAPLPAGSIVGTSGTVVSGNHKRVSVRSYFRINAHSSTGQIRMFGFGGQNGSCTVFFGAQDVGGFAQAGTKVGLRILTQAHGAGAGAYPWSTIDLVVGTWYRLLLDVDLDVGATTLLSATLRVTEDNASPAIDFTLTNSLNIGATDNLDKLAFGPGAVSGTFGKNATIEHDDLVYIATSDADAASGQPTLPAETKIFVVVPPTGEALNQWTGTHADVDEYPLSGVDTMTSSTAGAEVEFTHASGIALGLASIVATKLQVNALIVGAGTGSVDFILNGVAKNVTVGINYPGAGGVADPVGGILWSTLTPAAFGAITFGLKKQNGTQTTTLANIGLEVLGTPAAYGSGNQVRGETQIKAGSIFDAQIADAASIARHKVRGLADGVSPIFFTEESGDGDWMIPGPPGSAAPLVRVPVIPVFFDEGGGTDDGLVIPGPAGAAGAAGAAGGGGSANSVLIQVVNTESTAVATGTTVLPNDDTIPQNTEGDQYMSLSITPTSATNKLRIDVVIHVSPSLSGNWETAALFQDSTANALASSSAFLETATAYVPIAFTHYMAAGTTSATTFKVRAGMPNAGTTTFNGQGAVRRFGGVLASSITISEIAPIIGSAGPSYSGEVLLAESIASASASLDFVTRNAAGQSGAIFQADYDEYVVEFVNIVPATNATTLAFRVSTDGGATYDSGANYRYAYRFTGSNAATGTAQSNVGTSILACGALSSTASAGGANGSFRLTNPLSATQEKMAWHSSGFKSSDGNYYSIVGMGAYASTSPVNALRALLDSGNIASGAVRVYGLTKTPQYIASGKIVQVANTQTGASATGTGIIPHDDTIPQSTEGDQYMSLAFTPMNAASKLKIEVVLYASATNASQWMAAALFQDAGANALAAGTVFDATSTAMLCIAFTHYMTAGNVNATTFKVRAGRDVAGTTTFNGQSGARVFGGVLASSITITEILP